MYTINAKKYKSLGAGYQTNRAALPKPGDRITISVGNKEGSGVRYSPKDYIVEQVYPAFVLVQSFGKQKEIIRTCFNFQEIERRETK